MKEQLNKIKAYAKKFERLNKAMPYIQSVTGAACIVLFVGFIAVTVALGANGSSIIVQRTEKQVIQEMHRMANNYIVADDVWGKEEITKERIARLEKEVRNSDFPHAGVLTNILDGWNAGQFYSMVSDHNELWAMLDGTVGKATDIVPDDQLPSWHVGQRPITDLNVVIQQKEAQRKAEIEEYNKVYGTNFEYLPSNQTAADVSK